MKKDQIIRALRDPEYRASLTLDQMADLQSYGEIEIADETLMGLTGGCGVTSCASCQPPISSVEFSCIDGRDGFC